MRKRQFFSLMAGALVVAACAREPLPVAEALPEAPEEVAIYGADQPEENLVPDRMNIYVSEETAALLEAHTLEDGTVDMPQVKAFADHGVVAMRRLFEYAGKFEPRTRKAGLHRWYVVTMGDAPSITKAAGGVAVLPGVEQVELEPRIYLVGDPVVTGYVSPAPQTKAGGVRYPFDDPMLPRQWHYYNNGTESGSVSGCDINVFPVWRAYATGNPKVIVAVVDGGVDFNHEDLAANMWNNPEKTGNFRYGYNFVSNNYLVTPDDHGTHVAGTIAAVNNNGLGVCGIAGGNAAEKQKGVKIMSCQIFQGKESGSGAAAIKWGADHGAVISQNSWGWVGALETPATLRAAVDYFIAKAGLDENGKQTGPMKGGVVIFAAGNENTNVSSASYGPIISVGSVGANYIRAYYSCYGPWVDIAAPGGNVREGNQVLSTLPGNRYGYMQGTSMACPHVSGVAALVLSKMAATGYTADGLTKKLLNNTTNITSFNPNYRVGGLVNALKAIAGSSGGKAPKTPTDMAIGEIKANNVAVSITVPEDEDDGAPTAIAFYYSKSDFSRISENLQFAQLYVEDLDPGQTLSGIFSGMDFDADYYVAAAAVDALGNTSSLTPRVRIHTKPNNSPVITPQNTPQTSIRPYQVLSFDYSFEDPDGHYCSLEVEAEAEHPELDGEGKVIPPQVVLDTTDRNRPKIVASGRILASDKYTAKMTITDSYGATASTEVAFEVLPNQKPYVGEQMEDVQFNSRAAGTQELDCAKYFKDDDGEELSYSVDISNETVVNLTAADGKFLLTPMSYGYSDVTVTGKDVRGESVSQSFKVVVRDGKRTVEVYPNPVQEDLFFRVGKSGSMSIRVISASGATFYSGTQTASPFVPGVVDMRPAFPGVYTVIVEMDGETVRMNVVKL